MGFDRETRLRHLLVLIEEKKSPFAISRLILMTGVNLRGKVDLSNAGVQKKLEDALRELLPANELMEFEATVEAILKGAR